MRKTKRNKQEIINNVISIINNKKGKILSSIDEKTQCSSKIEIECLNNHKWKAELRTIDNGCWCAECSYQEKRADFSEIIKYAKSKNGKCLSQPNEYKNGKVKLEWECEFGHTWNANKSNVISKGKWCPECAGNKKLTIEQMHEIAKLRGGKCLSTKYKNSGDPLKWQCSEGHIWDQRANIIKRGCWCPQCSGNLGQKICKIIFETLFENDFICIRPEWLKNENGNKIELDGYCSKLNIAFEYNGDQHYYRAFNFQTDESLLKIKKHDEIKKQVCKKLNIKLLIIKEIRPYNINKITKSVLNIISKSYNIDINLINKITNEFIESKLYSSNLQQYEKIAISKGGKCLSKHYAGSSIKLEWQCANGHIFKMTPNMIQGGSWCKLCNLQKIRENTLNECKEYAKNKNGICISTIHKPGEKLIWICENNHTWKASSNIKNSKSWCVICYREYIKK